MGLAGRLHFARDTSGADLWKMVYAAPAPALAGKVLRYCGYVENTSAPLKRRELPFGGIPMIVNLGPAISVTRPGDTPSWIHQGAGFLLMKCVQISADRRQQFLRLSRNLIGRQTGGSFPRMQVFFQM